MWKMSLLLENGNKQATSSYTFEILVNRYLVHLVQLAHVPCTLSVNALYTCTFTHTFNVMCAYGWLTMIPLSRLRKRCKKVWIEPNHVSLIIIYEYKVVEWTCMRSNKCISYTWSTNMCDKCLSSVKKENERVIFSKSFEVLQDRHPCTISIFSLYTYYKCLV